MTNLSGVSEKVRMEQVRKVEDLRFKEYFESKPYLNDVFCRGEKSEDEKIQILMKGVVESCDSGDYQTMFNCLDNLLYTQIQAKRYEEALELANMFIESLRNKESCHFWCGKACLYEHRGIAMKFLRPNDMKTYFSDFKLSLKYRLREGTLSFDDSTEEESDYHTHLGIINQQLSETYSRSNNLKDAAKYAKSAFKSFFHSSKIKKDRFTIEDLKIGFHVTNEYLKILDAQEKYGKLIEYAMRYITILRNSKFEVISKRFVSAIFRLIISSARNLGQVDKANRLEMKLCEMEKRDPQPSGLSEENAGETCRTIGLIGRESFSRPREGVIKKIKKCTKCGKVGKQCKVCSTCKLFYYCSRKCQKRDWKGHKKYCFDILRNV